LFLSVILFKCLIINNMLHRYGIVYYEVMISISLDKRLGVHCSNIYIYIFFLLNRNTTLK